MEKLGAVIVAGGGSRRMGTPKARLLLGGVPLLRIAVDACSACAAVVIVAPTVFAELITPHLPNSGLSADEQNFPHTLDPRVSFTREEPAGSGPSAGLVAGLRALPPDLEQVQVLACDLPRAGDLVAALSRVDWPAEADALVPVDPEGWPQYLSARYRLQALREVVAPFGDARDVSIRRLLSGVRHQPVTLDPDLLIDVDDPLAAARAGITLPTELTSELP